MEKYLLNIRFFSLLFGICLLTAISITFAQTDIQAGDVSGTWTKTNSPYQVAGEITIPSGETLNIEPGAKVIFKGHFKFKIRGRLLAIGSPEDTIIFTAQSTQTGWYGLRFDQISDANDSSKLIYCKIQYGYATTGDDLVGGGILVNNFDKLLISHCLITRNKTVGDKYSGGGGIGIISSSPRIENNCISYNNVIGGHGGGIFLIRNSYPVIINNIIYKNQAFGGGGVSSYKCNPVFINNTIVYNSAGHGGALDCLFTFPSFFNTILSKNSSLVGSQVHITTPGAPNFYFCDVQDGTEAFGYNHTNEGNYNGTYISNIENDPMFLDTASDNYQLSDNSPCIGAGNDSIRISNLSYYAPQHDFNGNPRPGPSNSHPDIGACENALKNSSTEIKEIQKHKAGEFRLYQNFPNPFNPNTNIEFRIPESGFVKLIVYDILGKEVETLINEYKSTGIYKVEFRADNLPSGVYFYQLKSINAKKNAEGYTKAKMMLLIK